MMIMAKAKRLTSVLKEKAGPNHNAKFTVTLHSLSNSSSVIHYEM
jgi:hypothetical protein